LQVGKEWLPQKEMRGRFRHKDTERYKEGHLMMDVETGVMQQQNFAGNTRSEEMGMKMGSLRAFRWNQTF
jgi:hypothetical protein